MYFLHFKNLGQLFFSNSCILKRILNLILENKKEENSLILSILHLQELVLIQYWQQVRPSWQVQLNLARFHQMRQTLS